MVEEVQKTNDNELEPFDRARASVTAVCPHRLRFVVFREDITLF